MNYDYKIKLKEKLISQLAITKVLFERKQITEEDFNSTVDKISKNPNYSEYVEKASDVAWTQVDLIIETEAKKDKDYKNGKVIFNPTDMYGNVFCDVLMVSKNNLHAMKIVSMECDFIEPSESEEMMKIGYNAVNEYLCYTNSETINLIVIQPNLLVSTGCELKIDTLLEKFENRLIN